METICFYVSYFDEFLKRRVLSNGYIIPGKTKQDALDYLKEGCPFMKDIEFEYFEENTYYIDNSILLDLFKRFDKKF